MTKDTSSPAAARTHARSLAGTVVEAMPILPASAADALPAGVAPQDMIWAETLAGGGYAARRLDRGARIRLTDMDGDACLAMLLFNARMPVERLNLADTVKVQWGLRLGAGKLLLSDMGRVLASILEDQCAGHDPLCGGASTTGYGDGRDFAARPTARDRFLTALARFDLSRRDLHPALAWFKPLEISEAGDTRLDPGPHEPGRSITLRLEMDVLLVLANCPHPLDPRPDPRTTPVRVRAWRGTPTPEDDPVRLATPEGLRAFQNVENYVRS